MAFGSTITDVTISFLHTAEVHVRTFTRLVEELGPGTVSAHVVDESLLADAQLLGIADVGLRERLTLRLRESAEGADVVVCTCSTISGLAEDLAAVIDVSLVRVDRPMAERAVVLGSLIAVVAALDSTLDPTIALLEESAAARGHSVSISSVVSEGAWDLFCSGDLDGYASAVATTIDAIDHRADVVVLAQASMAPAALLARSSTPVLSSPRLAVEAALELA